VVSTSVVIPELKSFLCHIVSCEIQIACSEVMEIEIISTVMLLFYLFHP